MAKYCIFLALLILGACNEVTTPPSSRIGESTTRYKPTKNNPFYGYYDQLEKDANETGFEMTPDMIDAHEAQRRLNFILEGPTKGGCIEEDVYYPKDERCYPERGQGFYTMYINSTKYNVPYGMDFDDFVQFCTDYYQENEEELEAPSSDEKIVTPYSESPQVKRMIETMRKNAKLCIAGVNRNRNNKYCKSPPTPPQKSPKKATYKCLSYVKWGLMAGGFSKSYFSRASAKNSGQDLKRLGFSNLLEKNGNMKSTDAPIGAVLVFSGGEHGHVEVRGGENEWISDYISSQPRDKGGANPSRKLIGIYVKE